MNLISFFLSFFLNLIEIPKILLLSLISNEPNEPAKACFTIEQIRTPRTPSSFSCHFPLKMADFYLNSASKKSTFPLLVPEIVCPRTITISRWLLLLKTGDNSPRQQAHFRSILVSFFWENRSQSTYISFTKSVGYNTSSSLEIVPFPCHFMILY